MLYVFLLLQPCYVCNSTGHNCRALPRIRTRISEEEDPDGNLLSNTTESDSSEVEVEPVGVTETDFVLYVSAVETERCRRGLTVAYASHCQQDAALDRPVAGHANFCPGELSTKIRDLPSVMSTVKHEMLHALGFSVSLFAFYRYIQRERQERDKRETRERQERDKRENEAMTGTHTQNSVFSRITFALLEDTGWYKADYSHATPLDWGRGLGCNFAMKSCKQWLQARSYRRKNTAPFCSRVKGSPLRTECSPRRNAVVLCNLVRHSTILPRQYQHFDLLPTVPPGEEAFYGGSVSLADYCPYLQEFTWKHKSVLVRGSRCSYEENTPKTDVNFALENYGQNSKCFDHSDKVWEQKSCRQSIASLSMKEAALDTTRNIMSIQYDH
ncbi:hypothetical protein evm_010887 [Chilo suppressalis]|nr:hypothetical protein evm_010887 [Chilo suppressalis]